MPHFTDARELEELAAKLSATLKRVRRDAQAALGSVNEARRYAAGGLIYGRAVLPAGEPTDWDQVEGLVGLARGEYPDHELIMTIIALPLEGREESHERPGHSSAGSAGNGGGQARQRQASGHSGR